MKTKILLLFSVLLLLVIPNSLAFFTTSHEWWTISGLSSTQSPITQKCSNYHYLVVEGDVSSDIMVLHYFSKQFMSYVFTHVRNGYQSCLAEAGEDIEQQCFCHGVALHIIQDSFSHNKQGLTPKYLRKFFGSNLLGHMIIERNYENKLKEMIKTNNLYSNLIYTDNNVLNSLFIKQGDKLIPTKYINLLNKMTGLDVTQDAITFQAGYKGKGFYDTIYKDKVSLPLWAWFISFSLIAIGFGVAILMMIIGRTNWKWSMVFLYLIIGIIGVTICVSFFTGSTWQLTTKVIEIPASVGYMSVSDSDVRLYDTNIQEATNAFLKNGVLIIDDASGLSYVDRNGNVIVGALKDAEKSFNIGLFPILIMLFIILNVFLLYKSFKKKKVK